MPHVLAHGFAEFALQSLNRVQRAAALSGFQPFAGRGTAQRTRMAQHDPATLVAWTGLRGERFCGTGW